MARRPSAQPSDPDPLPQGLTHNPFSALKGKSGESPITPAASTLGRKPAMKPPMPAAKIPQVASGPPSTHARVIVRRERRGRGGKAVTLAEGSALAGCDLEELAREIARGLGTGARVEGGALLVQGDQPDRVVAWLAAHGFASVARGN